jgi:hypothetical protein
MELRNRNRHFEKKLKTFLLVCVCVLVKTRVLLKTCVLVKDLIELLSSSWFNRCLNNISIKVFQFFQFSLYFCVSMKIVKIGDFSVKKRGFLLSKTILLVFLYFFGFSLYFLILIIRFFWVQNNRTNIIYKLNAVF